MKTFFKFMFGYYWNETDARAVGVRSTMLFCWSMLLYASAYFFILIFCSGCISPSYYQRKVKEAREEEQARCERWLQKVASRELTIRDVQKLQGEELKGNTTFYVIPEHQETIRW